MTSEITERDRERAVKAYVQVLEAEGYWTKAGLKWDPTDPSISIIAKHIAAAREEGRQEERRVSNLTSDSNLKPFGKSGQSTINFALGGCRETSAGPRHILRSEN